MIRSLECFRDLEHMQVPVLSLIHGVDWTTVQPHFTSCIFTLDCQVRDGGPSSSCFPFWPHTDSHSAEASIHYGLE
jgi:hypothetical protein